MAHESSETPVPSQKRGPGRPRKETPSAQEWQCPACANRVTTFVPLNEPPRCIKHVRGGRVMNLVRTIPN